MAGSTFPRLIAALVRSLPQGSSEVLDRRHDVNACAPRRPLPPRPSASSTRRTDKREQAHDHLNIATTMYRKASIAYWLERVEEELK